MRWLRTDLMALGCIVGGAVAGGAATFALMGHAEHDAVRCVVAATSAHPRITITHGGDAGALMVAPNVRVGGMADCLSRVDQVVEVHMEHELQNLDAELRELDVVLERQLEGLERELELTLERELQAQGRLEEAKQKFEEARVRVLVKEERGGSL